jgi:uncharacterized phage-associated protein
MYEARKITNFVLATFDAREFELSNLRINKLLFFMHGWTLVEDANGLIRNHFEAWKLGPVVRSVYDAFKQYGDGPILAPASYIDYATGQSKPISFADVELRHREIIRKAFEAYARYPTSRLIELSHEPGSPWSMVFQAASVDQLHNARIPNDLIRQHFLLKWGGGRRH